MVRVRETKGRHCRGWQQWEAVPSPWSGGRSSRVGEMGPLTIAMMLKGHNCHRIVVKRKRGINAFPLPTPAGSLGSPVAAVGGPIRAENCVCHCVCVWLKIPTTPWPPGHSSALLALAFLRLKKKVCCLHQQDGHWVVLTVARITDNIHRRQAPSILSIFRASSSLVFTIAPAGSTGIILIFIPVLRELVSCPVGVAQLTRGTGGLRVILSDS